MTSALPRMLRHITLVLAVLAGALATLATCASAAVLRGPYLQQGTPTNILLRWRTDTTNIGQVRFGTNLANLSFTANASAPATNHLVLLPNLTPDTTYFYSIGITNPPLASGPDYRFHTAPPPGARRPFRVWALGDFGFTNESAGPVRDGFNAFAAGRHTDLFLMLGDNAYHTRTDAIWQAALFNTYSNLLRQTVAWSCIGNQEAANMGANTPGTYLDNFTFPTAGECGGAASGSERYFSFDHGNVHFICLDSMTSARTAGSAMLLWLAADLAQTTAEWIIAFWHHPPYTRGSNNSDTGTESTQMRANFLPLLENHGVDLVLSGHSHSYERSFLIDGHYGLSSTFSTNTMLLDAGDGRPAGGGSYDKPSLGLAPHEGAVYLVTGSGAQMNTGSGTMNHPVMARSLPQLGSVVLEFDANRLDVKFIRETGATNDDFTITKGAAPLRILSLARADATLQLAWQTVPRRAYRVQASAVPGPPWSDATSLITGDGSVTNVTLPFPSGDAAAFYRLWNDGN